MVPFAPHPLLRNAHLMTLAGAFWPRRFPRLLGATERVFEVEPGSWLLVHCHWQASRQHHPTLALVHGLEGSSASPYMLGTAERAFAAGFNVLRLNQRNCGDTEHLTPTLYNSGLSNDYRAVLRELCEQDGLPEIFFGGFSMGGNLVLKMAGELGGGAPPQLRAVCAIAPALDLAACATAINAPGNFFYQRHFVHSLKRRMKRKALLFSGQYVVDGLARVRTLREFDDAITAPCFGYRDAEDYYFRASAIRVVSRIAVPTLIVTAQDDPFVPFACFHDPAISSNPQVTLVATPHGGHCGFVAGTRRERFWAEARMVEFCKQRSELSPAQPQKESRRAASY